MAETKGKVDTTRNLEPYAEGNVSPKPARGLKPEVAANFLNKAKRPLLVVGGKVVEPEMLKRSIAIGSSGIPIAATGGSIKAFLDAGYDGEVYSIILNELTARLRNRSWKGFDGKGNYDIAAFFGNTYYYSNQFMSTLKNFVPEIRTINIEGFYCLNADFSFGNLSTEDFYKAIDEMTGQLKK